MLKEGGSGYACIPWVMRSVAHEKEQNKGLDVRNTQNRVFPPMFCLRERESETPSECNFCFSAREKQKSGTLPIYAVFLVYRYLSVYIHKYVHNSICIRRTFNME